MNIVVKKIQISSLVLCFISLVAFSGCAQIMAAKQPAKKDMSVLKPGTLREYVIAEFGVPATSGVKNGERVEMYRFKKGIGGVNRAGRVIFHSVADAVTLYAWEVVGTPAEAVFSGADPDQTLRITYDDNDKVKEAVISDSKLEVSSVKEAEKPVVKLPIQSNTPFAPDPITRIADSSVAPSALPISDEKTKTENAAKSQSLTAVASAK